MRLNKLVLCLFLVIGGLALSSGVAFAQGPLTNGANHSGSISAAGEVDSWTFSATQGDSLTVSLGEVFASEIDPGFWPWLRLIGPTGTQHQSTWGARAAQFSMTAPLSGTYTILVASADSGYDATGLYRLTLAKTPGDFVVPADDEGGVLTNGQNHDGVIHVGDLDQWSFTAAQNESIVVSVGEVLEGETDPGFWPWIRIIGPTGVQYRSAWGALATQVTLVAPLSGGYKVIVSTADSGYDATGRYRLTLAKAPGTFVVPEGDNGGRMANAVEYTGAIGTAGPRPALVPGDLDIWTFRATQNHTLVVNIGEIVMGEVDPGFWPWIRLFGPTGAELASSWGNLATQVTRVAPLSGTYTVLVSTADTGYDATGHYRIEVNGADPQSPPTTVNDAYSTLVNTPLTVAAPGVLANDNPNGGGVPTAALVSPVSSGTLALNADGSFTFTPAVAFTGTVTFTYRAVNDLGQGNDATVTIAVSAQPLPTAVADTYGTSMDVPLAVTAPGVLANDSANGGPPLSASLFTPPSNGTLALAPNGGFTYTPAAGFIGTEVFTYRATNALGSGNPATVSIVVSAGVPAPTGLYAASITGNVVTLRWEPPASGPAPTSYMLEGGISPGQTLASVATGSAAPIFTFTAPTGVFYVRVRAISSAGPSAASSDLRVVVNLPEAPSAPEGVVGLVNGSMLTLAWRNTFAGGAPGSIILDVTGSASLSIPLGLTDTFSFGGVPGGSYTFALRASNAAGVSGASEPVTLRFPDACSGPPSPPAAFLAYAVGNTLAVMWDPAAPGAAPTAYVLEVSGSFNISFTTDARALSGAVGPGTYSVRVSAVNPCGTSAPTATQTVRIP